MLSIKFGFYWLHFIRQIGTLQVMLLLLPSAGVLPWTSCADRGIENFPVSDGRLRHPDCPFESAIRNCVPGPLGHGRILTFFPSRNVSSLYGVWESAQLLHD